MTRTSGRTTPLLIAAFLLITLATGVQAQSCSDANIRCVAPITGPWRFTNGSYFAYKWFPSVGSMMAAVNALLVQAYSPSYSVTSFSPIDEFNSLLAMSPPDNSCANGGSFMYAGSPMSDWEVCAEMGVYYGINWANDGTWVLNYTGPIYYPPETQPIAFSDIASRVVTCPTGYSVGFISTINACYITTTALKPDKSRKPGCNKCRPSTPDPVDIAEGFMWENVDDIDGTGGPSLQRNYNSQAHVIVGVQGAPAEGFGYGWRTNYSRRVRYVASASMTGAYVERPNGQILYFSQNASTGAWSSDPDVHSTLTEIQGNGSISGWTYFDEDTGDTETYNSDGNLTQIVHLGGRALTFSLRFAKRAGDRDGRLGTQPDVQLHVPQRRYIHRYCVQREGPCR
ncbi:DUF6531 domain-containing protein [Dyella humi]|uniref:DUF6531 domain-containing protein n=1 Tax=Dyella humi TaxID=1770547 RepID=A0ABW8IN91_9GAMM